MPLLSKEELEGMTPVFRGKVGNALAECLMRMLDVDELNALYDRLQEHSGPDFASAVLNDIGIDVSIGYASGADADLGAILPEGPFITISNHPCGHPQSSSCHTECVYGSCSWFLSLIIRKLTIFCAKYQ